MIGRSIGQGRKRLVYTAVGLGSGLGLGLSLMGLSLLAGGSVRLIPAFCLVLQPIALAFVGWLSGRAADADQARLRSEAAEREELSRRLEERKRRADVAEGELRTILDHLDTGICTVSRDLTIDNNFNTEFTRIFGRSDLAGKLLLPTVFTTWDERQKNDVREAVELAFLNTASSEDMLNDILPKTELVALGSAPGDFKYVSVTLTRILAADEVEKVMFLFKDITLSKKLKEEEERHQRIVDDQFMRIHQLLKHERSVVFGFFGTFTTAMDRVAQSIKTLASAGDSRSAIRDVIAAVHTIKGEAFSLGLEACAEKSKAFEAYLRQVANVEFGLEQHLEVIGLYESLAEERRIFERMLGRMAEFSPAGTPAVAFGAALPDLAVSELAKPLTLACERAAAESGKTAVLDFDSPSLVVPGPLFQALKEALIHLVRNAVGHGIESAEERRAAGKSAIGRIGIAIGNSADALNVEVRDDGGGFNYERIRQKIVDKNFMTKPEALRLTPEKLVPFLFRPDFSTRDETDMVAGVGMGLYEVRRLVATVLKGKLTIAGASKKGVVFVLRVPLTTSVVVEVDRA